MSSLTCSHFLPPPLPLSFKWSLILGASVRCLGNRCLSQSQPPSSRHVQDPILEDWAPDTPVEGASTPSPPSVMVTLERAPCHPPLERQTITHLLSHIPWCFQSWFSKCDQESQCVGHIFSSTSDLVDRELLREPGMVQVFGAA
jgi:hypothetical protein